MHKTSHYNHMYEECTHINVYIPRKPFSNYSNVFLPKTLALTFVHSSWHLEFGYQKEFKWNRNLFILYRLHIKSYFHREFEKKNQEFKSNNYFFSIICSLSHTHVLKLLMQQISRNHHHTILSMDKHTHTLFISPLYRHVLSVFLFSLSVSSFLTITHSLLTNAVSLIACRLICKTLKVCFPLCSAD